MSVFKGVCFLLFTWTVWPLIGTHNNLLHAQDFKNSIVSTDFDFITATDPSAFQKLKFDRRGKEEMPGKTTPGKPNEPLFQDAFVFTAYFSDKTEVTIYIHAASIDRVAAKIEAMRFVDPLGKLPTALRQGVRRLVVHRGGKDLTAFSDAGLIVMYSDNATVRIADHDLEETIFHESVHAAWDQKYSQSQRWKRAQIQDGGFATLYARSKPELEDLAETALFAFTIIHHPQRLPQEVRKKLIDTVGNRILFIEELIPKGKPIHNSIQSPDVSPPR